ncbi:MAG TPA: DUF2062 domain-containing protein [Burkholderiales bacterium]|nr:DUF2062 domain-containing protein [Burkholderiales bacterium]
MPRKLFRKYLPTPDSIREHRVLGRFGGWLRHPNLWHLNRRSVAGGVANGLFCGLIPGPFQMLGAAILAVAFRVNLPVALFTTLYTNPLTIGPLYVAAYFVGRLLVGGDAAAHAAAPAFAWGELAEWMRAMAHWAMSLGRPLAVGLLALASLLAVLGYALVDIAWRLNVVMAWRRRRAARASRACGS